MPTKLKHQKKNIALIGGFTQTHTKQNFPCVRWFIRTHKKDSLSYVCGFTLIEFIVIISIFAIVASIALFNFSGFNSNISLSNL
ncbi:MAG: type II secretion system protein, partial [Candidatus Pacebacteria bacterium]|nr:type II secretion system protein [Candidatus Paceibacterota bacterium]